MSSTNTEKQTISRNGEEERNQFTTHILLALHFISPRNHCNGTLTLSVDQTSECFKIN